MKASVIVTAHNYGRFLEECLKSVLEQTMPDLEVIVIDDASTDDTPAILARYREEPRLSVLRLSGVGLAAAANAGIGRAAGDYVMRMDADDYLDRRAVAILAAHLDDHPDVAMVYPDHFTVREDGAFVGYVRTLDFSREARGVGRLPLPGGAMWRKTCLVEAGGFGETLRYQEDYDLWLRLTSRFQVAGVHLPLLYYRQHGNSMSRHVTSRAAARRYVKRKAAELGKAACGGSALIVIPTDWPGEPARAQAWLAASFGESSLLDLTLRQISPTGRSCDTILVAGAGEALTRVCTERGLTLVSWPKADAAVPGWPPALSFLRSVASERTGDHDYAALVSPFCPFRDPERLEEAVNTLIVHDCDVIVSVDAEPARIWTEGADGLRLGPDHAVGAGSARVVREAGELVVARMEVLKEGRPIEHCRVGYVELLGPEVLTVRDELSARICADLLGTRLFERLAPGSFLRIPGVR